MDRRIRYAVLFLCTFTIPTRLPAQNAARYSSKELKALMQSAQSPDDYRRLSGYFRDEAARFDQMADTQHQTMEQELQHPTRLKYPPRHEIAKRLRDYYRVRAEDAAAKASMYDKLLQSAGDKDASR